MDPTIVSRLIRIGRERVSPLGVRSAEKQVSPLRCFTDLSRDAMVDRLTAWFADRAPVREGTLTREDLTAAERMAASKYATPQWLDRL
jgi:lipoate-protein ligase A